ncbi:FAD-dependent monooxygenase [Terrilactibacillus sp. S3-3]|nr:FAD-dependent monooxygenase [Terrilactibacillus sp. S3-3]
MEETADGVIATNSRNEHFFGKAAIGADGLRSNVRKLISHDQPVCSKYVAYRGTIPITEISRIQSWMTSLCGLARTCLHVVQYPVRRGELYNQVVVFETYEYKEDSDDWGTPEEMERRFQGCHPLVQQALSFIQRQIRWPMYDRRPIDNWTKGNLTLLGDAAHPMLQYIAQGGCQALEDSSYLTAMLKKYGEKLRKSFS